MIVQGQYPTTYTRDYQNFAATDTILSLSITDETIPAYWIGWLKWENLCSAWHLSRISVADDVLHVEDVTRPENLDVGLVSWPTGTDFRPYANYNSFYVYKNGVWSKWTYIWGDEPTVNNRFLNKVDVNTTAGNNAYLQFFGVINEAGYSTGWVDLSIEEIISGTFTKSLTISGVTFTITQDDLDGTLREQTIGSNTIKYAVVDFGVDNFLRPINTAGGLSDYYYPLPTVYIHDTDGNAYIVGGTRGTHTYSDWIDGNGIRINPSTGAASSAGTFYESSTGVFFGGFKGDMPLSLIQETRGNDAVRWAEGCNYFVNGVGRYDISVMRRIFAWDDIFKVLSIQMRYSTTNTYATDSSKYYAKISPDNEFLCELANGETDRADLRPWQIAGVALDATSNTYETDQKPPYGEDDDEKIGDSIGFNLNVPGGTASGLYTMYALRQAHVNNLGAALWTSFNSPDSNFWQNVRMAAGLYEEAGSFDLSTILDFIASIRIYPFALVNLPGYAGAGTGAIKMGTGKIPLDLSTGGAGNVGIMGSYTGIIDAGTVSIPSHYGDFRDLEGVTMSVYLPYIGNVTLNPAEVTGQTLQATYAVDLTSGACVAYLLLSGTWGYYPIGVYSGTIGADIPLTASQGNRMFLRDMKNVLGLGSILGGSLSGVDATDDDALAGAIGSGLASGAAYMAKNVYRQGMGSALTPPTLGGGGANFAGFGAPQTAYVQIRRHLYAYNTQTFPASHMGRRSYGVHTLGTLSGFTVCDAVDVSGIPAPADIQTDIKKVLESGVYL